MQTIQITLILVVPSLFLEMFLENTGKYVLHIYKIHYKLLRIIRYIEIDVAYPKETFNDERIKSMNCEN